MRAIFRRSFLPLGVTAFVFGTIPPIARAGDGPATPIAPLSPKVVELPPDVVARVRGKDLSRAEFQAILVQRLLPELADPSSGAMGVFQLLIEEMVVRAEAARLGIRVSTEDYDRRYAQIDDQVRRQSGGERSLANVIKEKRMTPLDFRERLEDVIRKERIAGHPSYLGDSLPKEEAARVAHVEVVIQQILKKVAILRDGLPVGVVAKVNGAPMTVAAFGAALHARLGASEVHRILQETCVTMLLDQEGLAFTPADVDAELELDRPLWERMKAEAIAPEKRDLPFDGFLQLRYQATVQELHENPYRRGLFALRRKLRAGVADLDVGAAWTRGAQDEYGPSFVVTDILVSFQISKAVTEPARRRTVDDARRVIADLARRLAAGELLKTIEAEIKTKGDRSVLVEHRAVINKGNDLKVFETATGLKDGQWSAPVEGLSEMHLVRREAFRPAPTFDQVKAVVRQHLVDQKASVWLQERLRDDVVMSR